MLLKYVEFYAQEGLTVTHLGFLNEPDWDLEYSQMQISDNAQEAISFVPILDAAISNAGLDNLQVICCDAAGWDSQVDYMQALVDAGSTEHLDVITGHSYISELSEPLDATSLPKWNTEAGALSSEFTTTWYESGADNEGFTWAQKLSEAILDVKMSGYLYWEGFEVEQGQSASHLVDALDGTTVTTSGIFWAFAMWSRHIRPGAVRVAASGSVSDVSTGAFKNADGSIVLALTNSGSGDQTTSVSFDGAEPSDASAWVTDNDHTFESTPADLSGGAVEVSLPSKSVVTVKLSAWLVFRSSLTNIQFSDVALTLPSQNRMRTYMSFCLRVGKSRVLNSRREFNSRANGCSH